MSKLTVNATFEAIYLLEAKKYIQRRLVNSFGSSRLKRHRVLYKWIDKNLDKIICGSPNELRTLAREFNVIYKNVAPKKIKSDTAKLKKIFNYSYFCSKNSKKAFHSYHLLRELAQRICPYCDENFVFYMPSGPAKERAVRGPFDHYLAQDTFSIFAVSLYKLSPCCETCNSLKSNHPVLTQPLMNPYETDISNELNVKVLFNSFPVLMRGVHKNIVTIEFTRNVKAGLSNKVFERFQKKFRLSSRYENHRSFVCILTQKIYYYRDRLLPHFPGAVHKNEAKRHLFLTQNSHYEGHPLKKLEEDFLDYYY